jgi:hypothetical protein
MKLQVKRIFLGEEYTIGKLSYYDGLKWVYFCDTMEDKVRDLNKNSKFDNGEVKVYGKTAIPYGNYKMVIEWSPKFQMNLPLLIDVNSFEYIRIHAGNTAEDSHGCILVGFNKGKGKVLDSKKTLNSLLQLLKDSKDAEHENEII